MIEDSFYCGGLNGINWFCCVHAILEASQCKHSAFFFLPLMELEKCLHSSSKLQSNTGKQILYRKVSGDQRKCFNCPANEPGYSPLTAMEVMI